MIVVLVLSVKSACGTTLAPLTTVSNSILASTHMICANNKMITVNKQTQLPQHCGHREFVVALHNCDAASNDTSNDR